jgi:hypothetical protein
MHHGRRAPLAVTKISLPNAGLDGYLGELNFSALPFLTYIDLTYNSLHGKIPLSITSLPALSYLDFSFNWLHGSIPSEFGNMASLSQLGLRCNNLTGHIPASLGNLTTLVTLITAQNLFTGSIPEELGKLNNLEIMVLGQNPLSGRIPKILGNLTKLSNLSLPNAGLDSYLVRSTSRRSHSSHTLTFPTIAFVERSRCPSPPYQHSPTSISASTGSMEAYHLSLATCLALARWDSPGTTSQARYLKALAT